MTGATLTHDHQPPPTKLKATSNLSESLALLQPTLTTTASDIKKTNKKLVLTGSGLGGEPSAELTYWVQG